jgi:putative salt-induced outer membrane protein
MKWITFLFTLLTSNNTFARQSIIDSVYLTDSVAFDDNELSVIGEFGFLMAHGNTNT